MYQPYAMRSEPFSIEISDPEQEDNDENTPIQNQILNYIKKSPSLTIRPVDLSREFGISISDASAELCGLLQIVGEGSSFHFEDVEVDDASAEDSSDHNKQKLKTMVFCFPADFERKVSHARRKHTLQAFARISIKTLKVVTAFGLLVSIVIISVALLIALVAALVTLSRGGDRNSHALRNDVSRRVRRLFFAVRQLLFCYSIFGPTGSSGEGGAAEDQNQFFRETAYDSWLAMSLCCGNPGSIFFWWRADHFMRRWRRRGPNNLFRRTDETHSFLLENRNPWHTNTTTNSASATIEQPKNLIASIVEFLFGPAGSSSTARMEAYKWRLRSAVIISRMTDGGGSIRPIPLQELAPFVDSPPASLKDSFEVIAEGLSIVSFFNGVPYSSDSTKGVDPSKALFAFPELASESPVGTTAYDNSQFWYGMHETGGTGDATTFFYTMEDMNASPKTTNVERTGLPDYFFELPKAFTSLSRNQFWICVLLILANLCGVIWLSRSLGPGGILEQNLGVVGSILRVGLVPLLWFYARLFLAIPTFRLLHVVGHNRLCMRRNARRKKLASELSDP